MPNDAPTFPEGTRFFAWIGEYPRSNRYLQIAATPHGVRCFRPYFEEDIEEARCYSLEEVNSIIRRPDAREWREITREGFMRLIECPYTGAPLSDPELFPLFIHNNAPYGVLPPPVKHRIGVPKNKLP